MENKINNYLEKLVAQAFEIPTFGALYGEARDQAAEKIRNYFYGIIIDTLIDELDYDQVMQLKDLDFNSPEAEDKIIEISSQIPGFAFTVEEKLNQALVTLQQTQKLPE